jgi:tetratricopeptide (TPR) repeat protein
LLATNVDKYSAARDKVEKEYKSDRVAEAFRSEYAKAAKVCVDKGEIKDAIDMYELAIEDDPLNSALHDRFAWLLFNKTQDFSHAKEMAERAVELDPDNCDALVSLALIYYRLKDISSGDVYIDRAEKKGRTFSFCLLRKSIARYHQASNLDDLDESISMLEDALGKLIMAEKRNVMKGGYHAKNLSNIKRYQDLTRSKLANLRAKKTRINNAAI